MTNWIATIFASALGAFPRSASSGISSFATAMNAIIRTPLKAIAAFIFAPFMVLRVVAIATDSRRRWIAGIGLLLAAIFALKAGTFLGTFAGAIFIGWLFGPISAVGFWVGSLLSDAMTLVFQLLVLNATCFLFLGLSSKEVVDHLTRTSE